MNAKTEEETPAQVLGQTEIHKPAGYANRYVRRTNRKPLSERDLMQRPFAGLASHPVAVAVREDAKLCCAINSRKVRCGNDRIGHGNPFCLYHKYAERRHGVIEGTNAAWTEK